MYTPRTLKTESKLISITAGTKEVNDMTKEEFRNLDPYERYKAKDKEGNSVRVTRWDNLNGFVCKKGSRRYGKIVRMDEFMDEYTLIIEDENEIWHKRIARAIKAINKTGLWSDMLPILENLNKMQYQDKKDIEKHYFEMLYDRYQTIEDYNLNFRLAFKNYMEKYPFVFTEYETGKLGVKTEYIYETSECILKSMYFGKYSNKEYKEQIKDALKNNQDISVCARTSYDVRFTYQAKHQRAYYQEEYKNCGNGHYYMALDENTALFVEND